LHKSSKKTYFDNPGILLSACLSCFLLASCSPSLTVSLSPDGSGALSWRGSMSPTSQTLVRRFSNQDNDAGGSLFKAEDIRVSLALAGIKADSIATPDSATLTVKASIPDANKLPADCVRFDGKAKKAAITLSREVLAASLELMPPDTADYIELLMAPVFTGEELAPDEYRELVAAAYGKTIAAELAASIFTLSLSCPAAVTAAEATKPAQVKTAGKTANVTIALADLLTLSSPIIVTASW